MLNRIMPQSIGRIQRRASCLVATSFANDRPSRAMHRMESKHVEQVTRLHKFSKYNGQPIFDAASMKDIQDMLRISASNDDSHGIISLIAQSSSEEPDDDDHEEEEDGMDVLGCITGQIEGNRMELLTLVVRGDQRRLKVGQQLLTSLKDLSSDKGLERIETDVSMANDPALGFFLAQGFVKEASDQPGSNTTALFFDLR